MVNDVNVMSLMGEKRETVQITILLTKTAIPTQIMHYKKPKKGTIFLMDIILVDWLQPVDILNRLTG